MGIGRIENIVWSNIYVRLKLEPLILFTLPNAHIRTTDEILRAQRPKISDNNNNDEENRPNINCVNITHNIFFSVPERKNLVKLGDMKVRRKQKNSTCG